MMASYKMFKPACERVTWVHEGTVVSDSTKRRVNSFLPKQIERWIYKQYEKQNLMAPDGIEIRGQQQLMSTRVPHNIHEVYARLDSYPSRNLSTGNVFAKRDRTNM